MSKLFIPVLNNIMVKRRMRWQIDRVPNKKGVLKEVSYKVNSAKVVAVGPGVTTDNGDLIPVSLKVGDDVLLPDFDGHKIRVDYENFQVYREDEILATLHGTWSSTVVFKSD